MRVFFTNTISVERLANIYGDADQETYTSLGSLKGMVVSIAPQDAFLTEGNLSHSSALIADSTLPLQVSDRITVNSVTYIVRGVKMTEWKFGIRHQRAVIEKLNS